MTRSNAYLIEGSFACEMHVEKSPRSGGMTRWLAVEPVQAWPQDAGTKPTRQFLSADL